MTVARLHKMDDEIDRGIARWKSDRPGLDVGVLAHTARVLRLARHVELFRRDVLATHHLEVWEYDVLAALRTTGSPHELSPSALMSATQVASGTITNRIDRLHRRGYVTREPDPADRRGVLVRLTVPGRKKVDKVAGDIAASDSAMWQRISDRKREQFTITLRELLADFDHQ